MVQTLNATAKAELDIRRFPFDEQRLEAVFVVLGFASDQVRRTVDPGAQRLLASGVRVPQWRITAAGISEEERRASSGGKASALVLSVHVARHSLYFNRLVVLPLIVIAIWSWAGSTSRVNTSAATASIAAVAGCSRWSTSA